MEKMGKIGVLGFTADEEYGGAAMEYIEHVVVMEENSPASARLDCLMERTLICINQINRNEKQAQKLRYLPKLISGENIGALAMSEPNSESDIISMKLRAEKKGDLFFLNGNKIWITNNSDADIFVL